MKKVLNSELYYTGGGVWCAWGQFEDGSVLMTNNDCFYVDRYESGILDAAKEDGTDIYNVDMHTCEEYYIDYLEHDESVKVWEQILEQNSECIDLDLLKHQLFLF